MIWALPSLMGSEVSAPCFVGSSLRLENGFMRIPILGAIGSSLGILPGPPKYPKSRPSSESKGIQWPLCWVLRRARYAIFTTLRSALLTKPNLSQSLFYGVVSVIIRSCGNYMSVYTVRAHNIMQHCSHEIMSHGQSSS